MKQFPIIRKETQREFEKQVKDPRTLNGIPLICGHCGRACRQMDKIEGANRMNCVYCPLASFAEGREPETPKYSASSLYYAAVDTLPAEHIDHPSYGSDLYLKCSPEAKKLLEAYEFRGNVQTFRDQITGELWYDIPFAYTPFWNCLPG